MVQQEHQKFEMDSLAVFEKLLQGYKRAKESNVWESNINGLIEEMTLLPTEPFSVKLMAIFDFDYLVKAERIESIIEKSLTIREQLKHTERFITINEEYFSFPFLPNDTHLKKLEIFNSKGELCYYEKGNIGIDIEKLFRWLFSFNEKPKFQDIFYITHSTSEIQQLEIYYYSEYINLSTTESKAYYDFFCDYYAKLKFINYIRTNNSTAEDTKQKQTGIKFISKYSKFHQVVWANSIFNLIGLRLRENLDTSTLTKFLLLINNQKLEDYKNSYFYKLAGNLHELSSKKYYRELEIIKKHFQECNFPTEELDKEMKKLKQK